MLAIAAVTAHQAMAQTAQPQRIEITGSSIRRTDTETASPLQVITKAEIDQSGKGTVAEYLQSLTADGQGSVPFTYGRGFSGATSSGISLRGLGANATLVLINGRRVTTAVLADDFQRSYVDLNQIPLEAVERVEVLKDGASSTYGSDAVAGVVNIILRKNFTGTTVKLTYGIAEEGDGKEPRLAITTGFGDIATDGFNLLLNAEYGKRHSIYYRDRIGRNSVGVSALAQGWGFSPTQGTNNIAFAGGNGWMTNPAVSPNINQTTPSIIGNVRNPTAGQINWYSRSDPTNGNFVRRYANAGTFCAANANLPQNNPAGGCLIDARQLLNQIQPESETGNLYGRFTKTITSDIEAFAEAAYYHTKSRVDGLPLSPSGAFNTVTGAVSRATTSLGAGHPDNPYNAAARLSYLPLYDTGITGSDSKSHTTRALAGVKGTVSGWDFDTALSWSQAKQTDTATNVMNWRVADGLLNPNGIATGTTTNAARARAFSPEFAALPAGTLWRIGENAGLNSAAMYDALLDDKSRKGDSQQYAFDFKVSREFGQLPGGAIGVAFGGEIRREDTKLGLYDGLGDYIGLSLTSYEGKRTIKAAYTEVLLPVLKQLELSAAVRVDSYSDAGTSTNPKFGIKYKPIDSLALRGTIARGFRAPSFPEVSPKVVATFGGTDVTDTVRCNAGVTTACTPTQPTFAATGNPDLKPERSTSASLGLVWDITAKTSLTADLWQIKRKGLPVTGDGQAAVDAGMVLRDPAGAITPTDPGPLVNVFVGYANSDESLTRGFDIEAKQRVDLTGGMGRLTGTVTWSHLLVQRVIAGGEKFDYAGTHGNCDITNCIGSPKDKVSFAVTWDLDKFRLGTNVNYRGSMSNYLKKNDPDGCAQHFADGSDAPAGCRVKSFATLDLSAAWKFGKNSEIFGSVANVTDRKPPSDFETYGAIGYNPLDYSGAIGRFYRLGVKYSF